MTKTKKYETAGYRVHFDRLRDIRSKATITRTHKFRCAVQEEGMPHLASSMRDVARVVDSASEGSLLDFMIQLYGLGFLFCPSAAGKEILWHLFNQPLPENSLMKQLYDALPPQVRTQIQDKIAFYEFMTSPPRDIAEKIGNNTVLPQNYLKRLAAIFTEDRVTKDNIGDYPIIKQINDAFVAYARKHNVVDGEGLQKIFGITNPIAVKQDKNTFIILPMSEELLSTRCVQPIDIYTAYFEHLLPAMHQTSGMRTIQSLAGVADNQNALSNLWGDALETFRASVEDATSLIARGNPAFFAQNPHYLRRLAERVHEYATKIPVAKDVEFLRINWADYRTLVGGRLQSWLSNFENRLNDYEAHLVENTEGDTRKNARTHRAIFDTIAKTAYRRLFPQEQVMNFELLRELQPRLAEALQKRSKNLGKLLDDYTDVLQEFREFLAKWNNEGVPIHNNTDEKELFGDVFDAIVDRKKKKSEAKESTRDTDQNIIGFWKKAMIPSALERYPRFIKQAQRDPAKIIENAAEELVDLVLAGQDLITTAHQRNLLSNEDREHLRTEWFGQEYRKNGRAHALKTLERLKDLALRMRDGAPVWAFLERYIDWDAINNHEKSDDLKKWWHTKDRRFLRFLVTPYHRFHYTPMPLRENLLYDPKTFLHDFGVTFKLNQLTDKRIIKDLFYLNQPQKPINIDGGELLKIYWGLQLRWLPKNIHLPSERPQWRILRERKLANLLYSNPQNGTVRSDDMPRTHFQRFVAAAIGTEIRGKLSLLSRTSYIDRVVLQVTNGEQSILEYIPLSWGEMSFTEKSDDDLRQMTAPQRRRYRRAQKRLKKRFAQQKQLSTEAQNILRTQDIDTTSEPQEIATHIWQRLKTTSASDARALTRVLGELPHRWAMILCTKLPIEGLSQVNSGLFFEKSQKKSVFKPKHVSRASVNGTIGGYYYYRLPLETSRVQKQFLERFLWGDRTEQLVESIQGGSIIYEQVQNVHRDTDGAVQIIPGKQTLYWALPFSIAKGDGDRHGEVVEETRCLEGANICLRNADGKNQKQYRREQMLLGIDLGEYGFGYAVFDPRTEQFVESSFIEVPYLEQMRAEAASWRDTQSAGLFTRPTTHLAKIRELAAGTVRNQIHALALKYNAIPIYEDSVDGFESGGQRIAKLYKTLKTADIISGTSNEADAAVRAHIWGVKYAQIGAVIGAAKTSQTCRACGYCTTYEVERYFRENNNNQSIIVTNNALHLTFSDGTDAHVRCNLSDDTYTLREILAAIHLAQRTENEENYGRGQKAQFHCQYCGASCDADEQAAQNIALKYYFKLVATEEELVACTEKGILSTLKLFMLKSPQFAKRHVTESTTD